MHLYSGTPEGQVAVLYDNFAELYNKYGPERFMTAMYKVLLDADFLGTTNGTENQSRSEAA